MNDDKFFMTILGLHKVSKQSNINYIETVDKLTDVIKELVNNLSGYQKVNRKVTNYSLVEIIMNFGRKENSEYNSTTSNLFFQDLIDVLVNSEVNKRGNFIPDFEKYLLVDKVLGKPFNVNVNERAMNFYYSMKLNITDECIRLINILGINKFISIICYLATLHVKENFYSLYSKHESFLD